MSRKIDPLKLIRTTKGLCAAIAAEAGISRSAVAQWERVPAERVLDVERITGISRHVLRPDIYGPAPEAAQ